MSKLTDIGNIKELLSRHGFRFSKAMGQNFLVNPSICPRMAQACGAGSTTGVLEIGPGIGVLTCELAGLAKKVVSIELDKRLLPILNETLSEFSNVSIINADILEVDLRRLLKEEFSGMPVDVCANLPYYITSPVIMKLLEERLPIRSITVMVQKEAAERICALPGTREAGAVSLAVRYYAEPQLLFRVSRGSFLPSPNVDSAVIRLHLRNTPPGHVEDEAYFFRVIKSAFGQRRKTLLNSLSAGLTLPKALISELLSQARLPAQSRAEQLTMEDFIRLSNLLFLHQFSNP